jgi:flagellar assembly factor FliW
MFIQTTRFGRLEIAPHDVLVFPAGIPGLEDCREWVLLADAGNDALGWLQSTTRREIAFAVVSPQRFVAGYQIRLARSELAPLELIDVRDAQVLAIVGKSDRGITLNLKAPLVIHLARRLGRQVVANGDQPIQYELGTMQPVVERSRLKTA